MLGAASRNWTKNDAHATNKRHVTIATRSHVRFVQSGDLHWEEYVRTGPTPAPTPDPVARAQRPLLLLHGLSDSCRTWNRIVPALAVGRRVVALDLPGHGKSGRPDATYDPAFYARTVSLWLEMLRAEDSDFDSFDVVGHSLGGGIAQRLLLESVGPRIARLGLVSAGGLGTEVALPLRLAAMSGAIELTSQYLMGVGTRAGMRVLGGDFDAEDRAHLASVNARAGTARALARTLKSALDYKGQREHLLDHAHRLERLPPIRVFWGDKDQVIPVAHAHAVLRFVDGATVRRFAKAGHYPHREAALDLLPELTSFLDEEQPEPRVRFGSRSPRAESRQAASSSFGRLAKAG